MKNIADRFKTALFNEKGASNLELIVWFSVVLVIATALFVFKDIVIDFIEAAGDQVETFKVK